MQLVPEHALGINTISMDTFLKRMYPIVKGMLDEVCNAAKDEMKKFPKVNWGRGHMP